MTRLTRLMTQYTDTKEVQQCKYFENGMIPAFGRKWCFHYANSFLIWLIGICLFKHNADSGGIELVVCVTLTTLTEFVIWAAPNVKWVEKNGKGSRPLFVQRLDLRRWHQLQHHLTPLTSASASPDLIDLSFITFTFSHLADAFIQSDLHMCDLQCIHILHLRHTAHQEQLGVQCLAQGRFDRESN